MSSLLISYNPKYKLPSVSLKEMTKGKEDEFLNETKAVEFKSLGSEYYCKIVCRDGSVRTFGNPKLANMPVDVSKAEQEEAASTKPKKDESMTDRQKTLAKVFAHEEKT